MPFHLTIEPIHDEDGLSVEGYAERVLALKPVTVLVDCSGIGRTVLASLQARGIPAGALEKRPRPTLPEVRRAEEESRKAAALQEELRECQREKETLEKHQNLLRILIERLE